MESQVTRTDEESTGSKTAEKVKREEDREMSNVGFSGVGMRAVPLERGCLEAIPAEHQRSGARALALSL